MTYGEYRQVKERLERDFFFIAPESDYKVDSILDRAKYLVRRKGIKGLVIDPYNRLENEQGRSNETQYISNLLDKLTSFAQRNDVLIILMAHPTKMQKNKEGNIEIPTCTTSAARRTSTTRRTSASWYTATAQRTRSRCVFRRSSSDTSERLQRVLPLHLNNGRYTPTVQGSELDPTWDNSNHLVEEEKRQYEEAFEASRLEFPVRRRPARRRLPILIWKLMETNIIYNTDCLTGLHNMPDDSIDCCVTSPPYFNLRDYGVKGQIGLEDTPEQYIQKLVGIFHEVRRILAPAGTLW